VSVGERPELTEDEGTPSGPGGSLTAGVARGKRGRPRRTVAVATDAGMDIIDAATRGGGKSVVGVRGGGAGSGSRERNLRRLLAALRSLDAGDFSARLDSHGDALISEITDVFNSVASKQDQLAGELSRVALSVGSEGKMRDRATIGFAVGRWASSVDALNSLITDLVQPTSEVARVIRAVADGDLSQKVALESEGNAAQGEYVRIGSIVNRMVDQLNAFASEVTRVAREVGTEGRLGGQANVPGVAGTWKDLTDSVNFMASNLTSQVRNIALVTTAVANGDLSQKITVEVRGEILELKNTVNTMVEKLRVFADEVTRVAKEVGTEGKLGGQAEVPGVAGTWKALTDAVNAMANLLTAQVRNIADVATAVTKGDLTRQITVEAQGELDELKSNLNQMIANLKETTERNQEQDWLKTNLAKFSLMMQGQKDLEGVSRLIMSELTPLVSAHHGAFFIMDQDQGSPMLRLVASYAYRVRKNVANRFAIGEGLVGQAALEKHPILLQNVPDDYIQITSGLGEAPPRNIVVLPVLFEGQVKAVIELASFLPFSQIHQTFLDQLAEAIGVVLNMIGASMRTEELLEQSQKLTQELLSRSTELQQQQDELKRSNAELEAQARTLRQSEEMLKEQREELQQVNEELEEKASMLAEQNQKVEHKNREVEAARLSLEEKAEQLALSSKYKSEFLANMSHELRTPLNSLLILAKLLSDNKEGTLTPKQVEFAQTIYSSGTDLLNLINDILDLSKVEAGKMEVNPMDVPVGNVESFSTRTFEPIAQQKGLRFTVDVLPHSPSSIYTDGQRLQQVLKNLLSNAFKFTEKGGVTLTIGKAERGKRFASRTLDQADEVIAFAVSDTGIGIAQNKQQLIFEAFQQADGTTSRKFGGTGLGLSISREIARLLGGEIRVGSTPGAGSTFTLFLPSRYHQMRSTGESSGWKQFGGGTAFMSAPGEPASTSVTVPPDSLPRPDGVEDDRETVEPGDRVFLIIENDIAFSKVLLDMAREKGFKGLNALDGKSGIELAHVFEPDAIILDIDMSGMDGWAVLDRLKHDPLTRHIPVHIITGMHERQQALMSGAFAYLQKPVTKEALDDSFAKISSFIDTSVKRLLVVEDDDTQRESMVELIQHDDVEITALASAEDALRELSTGHFDCMVLDLGLKDMNSFVLLEKVKANSAMWDLPIIIYTGKDLSPAEDTKLRKFAETIIVKDVKSPERLLDETALFLHRVEAKLPEQKRRMLERLHNIDASLTGKRVLVVDDDVRNIFSLTSMLEDHGVQVSFAENGRDAIALLRERQDFDLVLMDVMMPEMDGYETTRAIRDIPALTTLPIIALTAKAMKGDREKCIAAGASDYITKPMDTEQLLSLMRVWLYR
jgi:CheY-like chemotaxis protein/signal transduction histidine kinase/HAMP domain-containing protein